MALRKVYDQAKDVPDAAQDAYSGRAYREAAALISELDLWGCGAPPEVLISLVAASWLAGVTAGLSEWRDDLAKLTP